MPSLAKAREDNGEAYNRGRERYLLNGRRGVIRSTECARVSEIDRGINRNRRSELLLDLSLSQMMLNTPESTGAGRRDQDGSRCPLQEPFSSLLCILPRKPIASILGETLRTGRKMETGWMGHRKPVLCEPLQGRLVRAPPPLGVRIRF